jgi:signal transduction histidine kinase
MRSRLLRTQAELQQAHQALVRASRQAGMAEVASSVLHNVGNVLNSVNVSANLLDERIQASKASGLVRVAAMLTEQGDQLGSFIANDERGKRLPAYLAQLSSQLLADRDAALEELASLVKSIEHIKDIVRMQQSYATHGGVLESVAVADLVNDSVRLNAEAFTRHGVKLACEFEEVPAVTVDKHRVLQIMVNLIRNAKYACDDSGRSDKRITIRVTRCALGVAIAVVDNGVGITAENLPRIFSHGFTTRAGGHGFGLHSAALAAQELKGSLRVASDGPGCGATFRLELPITPAKDSP